MFLLKALGPGVIIMLMSNTGTPRVSIIRRNINTHQMAQILRNKIIYLSKTAAKLDIPALPGEHCDNSFGRKAFVQPGLSLKIRYLGQLPPQPGQHQAQHSAAKHVAQKVLNEKYS